MRSTYSGGLLLAGCLLAGACSDAGSGRYHLSGNVTFDGKPVPAGKIYFHADIPRGNSGPPAFADINQGAYDTRKGGSGGQGGPVLVAIEGFDGKANGAAPLGQP